VLAVRRDIDIVQAAIDRNRLLQRQGRGIDDVERAFAAGDADHDAVAVLGDREVVGMIAERHLLQALAADAVEYVERRVRLVADVDLRTVRREGDAVGGLDAPDDLHHLVAGRIDHVDAVARAVGDIDADGVRRRRERHERECEPQMLQHVANEGHRSPAPWRAGIPAGTLRPMAGTPQSGLRVGPGHGMRIP
jgi:hypothetical protein